MIIQIETIQTLNLTEAEKFSDHCHQHPDVS